MDMAQIRAFVATDHPGAIVSVETFPSGSVSMEIRIKSRVAVVDYRPGEGYGASLLAGDSADAFTGHDAVFESESAVIRHLVSLLA